MHIRYIFDQFQPEANPLRDIFFIFVQHALRDRCEGHSLWLFDGDIKKRMAAFLVLTVRKDREDTQIVQFFQILHLDVKII